MVKPVWITEQSPKRVEHAVSDDAQAEARDGVFAALCGETFVAASMSVAPVGGQCRYCVARLTMPSVERRMPPSRSGPLARLLAACFKTRADADGPPSAPTSDDSEPRHGRHAA